MKHTTLDHGFFQQPVVEVAHSLIGKMLFRQIGDTSISGIILETEAYDGEQDQACHAHSGKTKRNAVKHGAAGHAYITSPMACTGC